MRISGICGNCNKYYSGEVCPACEEKAIDRTLNFIADLHDSYYDHGLGRWVKSRQDRKVAMKEKGLIEVGNERTHVMEGNKRIEQKAAKEWSEVDKAAMRELARWN